ncbi:MAG: preprotein translocase subunit YajC [Gaiellales bacterium]|jgi:preprotein translocase subunit YajC|nr:preprotein translocase subunit YajC [Gaiellales bacterium]
MSAYILWIPLILLVAWLMIIRPQRNARRRAAELSGSLDVGDEVVTIGGLYGQIVTIDDRSVELDVAEGVTLRFARRAIAGKAPVDEPEDEDVEDDDDLEDDEDDLEEDDDLEDDAELGVDDELEDNIEPGEASKEEPASEPAPSDDKSSGR